MTTPVLPTFAGVLASIKALKSDSPMLPAIIASVNTIDLSYTRMIEVKALLTVDRNPNAILDMARLYATANKDAKMAGLLSQFDALTDSLNDVSNEIAAIIAPEINEKRKESLSQEFATAKDQIITMAKAMETFAPMLPEHSATLTKAADFLMESLPTLRGTGIVKGDKADDLAKKVREFAYSAADSALKVAGFQFGKDDNGVRYVIREDGERVTISSKGRIADTLSRAYRAHHGTTMDA